LNEDFIDVNGIFGTGFNKYGMNGVSIVLGIFLRNLSGKQKDKATEKGEIREWSKQ